MVTPPDADHRRTRGRRERSRRDPLDAALAAYYEAEAAAGARSGLAALRHDLRAEFACLLAEEGRRTLVDVGAGPGLDAVELADGGFDVVGLDLALGNAVAMRARGVAALAGSVYALPFHDRAVDAVWTMSTLVHVPDVRLDAALGELVRIVARGGPIGIGTWGGRDWEGTSDLTRFDPPRFFSLRGHDRWRALLARHGSVERFAAWESDQPGWEYQFAVLRA